MSFDAVRMPSGHDWLMRPVVEGLCRYESLVSGELFLNDIAEMHDALDVHIENKDRFQAALVAQNRR